MQSKDFRFEDSLNTYINQVKQTTPLSQSDEKELRAHLYDASADLQKCGLNIEEAFIIASKRLGRADQVGEEYRKVNVGLVTDNIWAYMLVGFSFIASLLWLYRIVGGNLQLYMVRHFTDEPFWIHIVLGSFNLLVCVAMWSVLLWGKAFSARIQQVIQQQPGMVALIMVMMVGGVVALEPILRRYNPELLNPQRYIKAYPRAIANSIFVEFSWYLTLVSAAMVILLSVFSISTTSRLSIRNLFRTHSYPFLFIFGLLIELMAATTRMFQSIHILFTAVLFALVYATGSYLISYYNRSRTFLYIAIFLSFGLICETWRGILGDLSRGSFYTFYYVVALLVGVLSGWVLGKRRGFGETAHLD